VASVFVAIVAAVVIAVTQPLAGDAHRVVTLKLIRTTRFVLCTQINRSTNQSINKSLFAQKGARTHTMIARPS